MYFPNSQIQTNLYSGGDLVVLATGQPYTGFYWATSNGKYFAGKTPSSPQSKTELIKYSSTAAPDLSISEPSPEESPQGQVYNFSLKTIDYLRLRGITSPKAPDLPKYIPPSPTKEDYQAGEFIRYFCKKKNETLFIEIDQKQYEKLKTKNKSLDHTLYSPFELPWAISGDRDKIAIENKNTVDYKENREHLIGLSQYLNHNYLQLFNSTPGIVKQGLNKVYTDSGEIVPINLPPSYQLGNLPKSLNQQCLNCTFYKAGLCQKWSAKIREEYWCETYTKNVDLS